jgi:ABC-type amino acid transport substrate-binding protein
MTNDQPHSAMLRGPRDKRYVLRSTKHIILLVLAVGALLWFAPDVAAWLNRKPDKAWARVRRDGVIRFAIDASYMPFDGLGSHNDFFGIDVDIANEVARRIGVRAEFVNTSFDSLYDVLKVGQADATISALVIDPARVGNWQYSTPYFDAGQVAAKPARSLRSTPVETSQVTIAVEYGSEGDAAARRMARRTSGITIKYTATIENALQSVATGQADEAIIDGASAAQLLPKYPALQRAEQVTRDPYAIAVWSESTQLLEAINGALDSMRRDGTTQRIVDAWMNR